MRSRLAVLLALVAGVVPNDFAQLCPPVIRSQRAFRAVSLNTIQSMPGGGYIQTGIAYPGADIEQTSPNYGLGDLYLVRLDATGARVWDQTFGGTNWEISPHLQILADGFILAGDSESAPSGNKTSPNLGNVDFWLIRTDSAGNKLWERTFGGTNYDSVACVRQTADGGFIIGGSSQSGFNGNKTGPNYGYLDYWVVRVDSAGNKLWDRSFGGEGRDVLTAMEQTPDGGFLLGGTSESIPGGNKTALFFGGRDYWIIRIDANGNELWQNSFGGGGNDELAAMAQSSGGFALVGSSDSIPSDTKTAPLRGLRDYWIILIDQNGNRVWDETAGGNYSEPKSVLSTADGGWVVGGRASGPGLGGNQTSPTEGYSDYWLVRFNINGAILWNKTFGGNSTEDLQAMEPLSDGGILVSGRSESGAGGNRTVPLLGYSDLWVLKIGPETPGDCDGDGVPDEQDLCANSAGAIVNTNGCSIAQLCPCDGGWTNHAEYVSCVDRTSSEFLAAGRITPAERENIMAEAAIASCPIPPIIAFGLTNFPIHEARVSTDSESGSGLFVSNLGFEGFDGVSMRLGEADSGIFIYPDAPIQYNFNENWFLLGKAYGTVNGISNSLISTLRARKPYYETYPVDVDFSQLGASSLTFQAYLGTTLVAENTQIGPVGSVTITSASYLGPRANPFWRAADGSIGAVIDFETSQEVYRFGISGLIEETQGELVADRLYVRANSPTNLVNFVSRLDVLGGGGLTDFSGLNARLGMFRRPHQILGAGLFDAAGGKLRIGRRQDSEASSFIGTLIEAKPENLLDVTFEPLILHTNGAVFQFYGSALVPDPNTDLQLIDQMVGSVTLTRSDDHLQVNADFSPLYNPPDGTNAPAADALVLIKIYRGQTLVGTVTNSGRATDLVLRSPVIQTTSNSIPAIAGCAAAVVESTASPFLSFSLDAPAVLSDGTGAEFYGNRFRFVPIDPQRQAVSLSALSPGIVNVPSFTIIAESAQPALTIAREQNTVVLSWPRENQTFVLESTSALGTPFEKVTADVTLVGDRYTATVPIDPGSNRFFRLALAND